MHTKIYIYICKQHGHVVLANIGIGAYKYIYISFGEQILLDFDTHDVGFSNSITQPMKLR